MNDLIIAAIKDRGLRDIDCYVNSLAQSGCEAHRVMFVSNVSDEAQDYLRKYHFEVIPFTTGSNLHFQTERYNFAIEYLKENWQNFRYVMWTDVCDLVFQRDPMEWMENNVIGKRIVAAKEGRIIGQQDINKVWIERLNLGDGATKYILGQEILCSGTIQGDSESVYTLFLEMRKMFGINDMQGIDQGIYNVAVRKPGTYGRVLIPEMEDAFISTCGSFLSSGDGNNPLYWTVNPPYFDRETGLVMTTDKSKTFHIVHQYNRAYGLYDPTGDWRHILERRYR